MLKIAHFTPVSALCICLAAGLSQAQTTTPPVYDAGALMRQTEQTLKFEQMQRNAQRRESLPPAMVLNETTQVTATRIKFAGVKRLSEAQLQAVVQPYVGRPLNQHELQHLTDAISQAYRDTGWLVQAYIPRQDLASPELLVQVIESIPPSQPRR